MSDAGTSDPAGGASRRLTAGEIADAVGGRVVGDAAAVVHAVAPLDRAGPDDVSFLAAARYLPLFERSRAGVVLVAPEVAGAPSQVPTRVIVAKPHEALLVILARLHALPERVPGVHASAVLGRGVRLGAGVTIGPQVVLGDDVEVGDGAWIEAGSVVGAGGHVGADSHLYPGVTIYPGCRVGRRVALHAGVRIGSDGFGYVFRDGAHQKVPHVGGCVVEDDVEIGANTTLDRGSIGDTVIGAGSKIDNLVHVGHNVRIGRRCLLMAQVGIAGSAQIEDGVIIAGQAGIAGHITIGRGARIGAQAGVFGDVPAGETWSGYPARPHRESMRAHAAAFRMASLLRPLERLLARDGERPKGERSGERDA